MTLFPSRTADLASLVSTLDAVTIAGDLPASTSALVDDSRAVVPGATFVALRGARVDGHAFVRQAIDAGATAVVVDEAYARAHGAPANVATIVVPDTAPALARMAAAFFGYPARELRVAGVTGTNGKTTTTHLIAAVAEAGGIPAGVIGTLGASFAGATRALANTTPLALELTGILADMRDRGAKAVAMEVSSHALAQGRASEVRVDVGVLTNVTRDHLDFHQTFEAYAAVKRSLFAAVRVAVLCIDDAHGARWAPEIAAEGKRTVTYGLSHDASVCAHDVVLRGNGSTFDVDGTRFDLRLPGRFNVQNALGALCVAREFGVDDATAARALRAFEAVPGRMEHLTGSGIDVLVDYAHTPDALAAVLRAARETTAGALVVVFGCGGDRDRGKRPEMGRIACELADRILVTSDNPRSESPQAIVDQIVRGAPAGARVDVELDRRRAIARAVAEAEPGDVVVVAGKGHENYQIVGGAVLPFDDRDEVRAALARRAAEAGA